MKKNFVLSVIFSFSIFFSQLLEAAARQAQQNQPSPEAIEETARGFQALAQTAYNAPIVRTYEKFCANGTESRLPFQEICKALRDSKICKKIPAVKRLVCSTDDSTPDMDVWGFLSGCGMGLFNSVRDIVGFLMDLVTVPLEQAASLATNGKPTPELTSALRSTGLYVQVEYAKAYEETEAPFREIRAMGLLAADLGKTIFAAVQKYVTDQVDEFGCLNFKARSELLCKTLGDLVIPPAVLVKLLARYAYLANVTDKLSDAAKSLDHADAVRAAELARIEARADKLIPPGFSPEDLARLDKAEKLIGKQLTPDQRIAIIRAHEVGRGKIGKDGSPAMVGNYTAAQLKEKAEKLKAAGLDKDQIRLLMENKIVGDEFAASHWKANQNGPTTAGQLNRSVAAKSSKERAQEYRSQADRAYVSSPGSKSERIQFSANYHRLEGEMQLSAEDGKAARQAFASSSARWREYDLKNMSERNLFDARRAAANAFDQDDLMRTIRSEPEAREYVQQASRMINEYDDMSSFNARYEKKALANAILQVQSRYDFSDPGMTSLIQRAEKTYKSVPESIIGK